MTQSRVEEARPQLRVEQVKYETSFSAYHPVSQDWTQL